MSFGGGGGGSGSIATSTDVALSNPSDGQVLKYNGTLAKWQNGTNPSAPVTSVNSQTGVVTLAKTDVGLGNVDNTSDVSKPVSTATQTALNLKAPLASPTFTGTVTVPTPTNPTDAVTKSYADSAAPDATTSAKGKVQLAGDLAGTAASPSVAKVNGIAVSGTPSVGQALTASSTSAATWTTPSLVAGTGTAAKVWITSTDPGSSAAEGDIWING